MRLLQAVADPVGARRETARRPLDTLEGLEVQLVRALGAVRHAGQTPALRCPRRTGMQLGAADKAWAWSRLSFKIPTGDSATQRLSTAALLTDINPLTHPRAASLSRLGRPSLSNFRR